LIAISGQQAESCETTLAQGAGNMFPKSGNKFPEGSIHATEVAYAAAIAEALASDVGTS
jgi:hypothetical protein